MLLLNSLELYGVTNLSKWLSKKSEYHVDRLVTLGLIKDFTNYSTKK